MRVARLILAAAGLSALVAVSGPARAEDDEGLRHHQFQEQLRHERAERREWREERWRGHREGPAYVIAPPAYYAAPPAYYEAPPAYYAPPPPIYRTPGFSIGFGFH